MPLWIASSCLVISLAFLVWIDTSYVRYTIESDRGNCSIWQIIRLPRDVDAIAIGSSRVRRGFDPKFVVSLDDGRLRSVYNLGRRGRDVIRNYVMFRDLLERGVRPKFAYIEINIDALSRNGELTRVGRR